VYVVRGGNKCFIVIDGKEGKRYDDIAVGSFVFSPDGKHWAYVAQENDKQFVIVDGKEGKQYNSIITIGGGRIIFDTPHDLHYLAWKDRSHIYFIKEKIVAE
jgi:hypothetical protein